MNSKMVLYITGKILSIVSLLLILPVAIAVIYGEINPLVSFLFVIGGGLLLGTLLVTLGKTRNGVLYAKDGFIIVTLVWLIVSVEGALPFVISGEIPSFVDAFFETVSGFTTTGASILTNVEALSKSMLFWRSFTHWIGGMGVLVFVMAIMPSVSDRSIHILRAEMPGPVVDKIVPRAKDTAKILYLIYIGMTATEIILLCLGGMPIFDSFVHSLGTAGTGGFGIKANSIAGYNSYCQWVIGIFMVIFGVNFNVYYLLLIRRSISAFKSSELWTYISVVLGSTALIAINVFSMYKKIGITVRDAFFQVSSIVSTTGYSTTDFDKWPTFSKSILLGLMVCGACGGSTAGGIKVSRVVILVKVLSRKLKSMLHPRAVLSIKMDDKTVDEETVSSVAVYAVVYMILVVVIFLLLCIEPYSIETHLSATLACFNNIGPGLQLCGPANSYAFYSDFSKIVLSFAMLLGRLEIFPVLLFFSPSAWRKAG